MGSMSPLGPEMDTLPVDPGGLTSGIAADVMAEEGDTEADDKQEEKVRRLFKRIAEAKKFKEKWEQNFQVDRSHDYVKGFQRSEDEEFDAQGDRRYQINKILSAMKSKIPRIFYYHPYLRVRGSRGREDTPQQTVQDRCNLLQDTVNSIIWQPETRFKPECLLAVKEAQWAFGVVETGYSADWGDNPFAKKPTLLESDDVETEKVNSGEILDPSSVEGVLSKLVEVPHKETFYVKHIPARQFYVASNDRSATETQDWVAYWEWMYVEDVKRSDAYQNTDGLRASAKMQVEGGQDADRELRPLGDSKDVPADMVRIWKYWDQRDKKRYVLAEGHDELLREEEYELLPLHVLRLEIMPGEWYPIPPIFTQLVEQDEYNDAREWLRLVRKGTRPRYLYDKQAFTAEELQKFETDEFNTMVGVDNGNLGAIAAVNQPSFSEAAIRTLALAESGFAEQAASSPQARLTRDGGAPTAREVSELSQSGDIRDSYEQQEVADWLSDVGRGILKCAIERMTLPRWVEMNTDPHSPVAPVEAQVIANTYQQITAENLEDADSLLRWDITVDIESMSPATEAQYVGRIMQALTLLASPGPGGLLALSPQLLKLVLNMMGLRNEYDLRAIMAALQARAQQQMQMAMAGAGGPKGVAPSAGAPTPNAPPPQKPPEPPGGGGGGAKPQQAQQPPADQAVQRADSAANKGPQ